MQYLQLNNCQVNTFYQYMQCSSCSVQNLNLSEEMHEFFEFHRLYWRESPNSLEEVEYGIQASMEVLENWLILR
jgi:hypothetical protein